MELTEKRIDRKDIFEGYVFNAYLDKVEIADGSIRPREVIEHNGGVCVVAIDDEHNIYMVRQFRYAVGKALLELPAGKLEKGEDPLEAAKRELSEETGFSASEWMSLGFLYPTPGYCSEKIYVYLARDLTAGEIHLDDGEILVSEKLRLCDAVEMIMRGEVSDAKTVFGVLKADKLIND